MGKGHPLRVLAGLLLGDPPPFVRIELDDRGRLAARLPETAQQCRENAPLQGWDEQQSTGDVGQKPGNEQQKAGEDPTDVEHRCDSLVPRLARTAGSSKLDWPRNAAGRRSAGAGPGTAQPCAYIISTEFASKSATKPRAARRSGHRRREQ